MKAKAISEDALRRILKGQTKLEEWALVRFYRNGNILINGVRYQPKR